jgi:hypothetical protein
MELPAKTAVPLPAFVDDWADQQCAARGIAFGDLVLEAVQVLRSSLGPQCASGTPLDADLATWFDAEVAAYSTGPPDRVTDALCTLCAQHTGADLVTMDSGGWRRLPPPSPQQAAAMARLRDGLRRQLDAERQMRKRGGPLYQLSKERSRVISEAWRAAGRPQDPRRRWDRARRNLTVPDSERFNVYVWPERIGEGLQFADASSLLAGVQHSKDYRGRPVGDFQVWPVTAEPMPEDPKEREAKRLAWLRSIGLTAPHPSEDTPERQAWSAWQRERARIRRELGW